MKDLFGGMLGQVEGKLKEQFGNLSEEDLAQAKSNPQAFIAKIQEKSGGSREEIAQRLRAVGLHVPGVDAGTPPTDAAKESAPANESEEPA